MSTSAEARREFIEAMDLVAHLSPVLQHAAQLRSAGIRVAIDRTTHAALEQMAQAGNREVELILATSFLNGHLEVALVG